MLLKKCSFSGNIRKWQDRKFKNLSERFPDKVKVEIDNSLNIC